MTDVPEAFLKRVQNDPLFAAEGMDLEQGIAAVDAIEGVLGEVESAYYKDSLATRLFFARYPLAKYAVPLPFVRAFIESERARRTFIAQPTHAEGEQLILQWRITQAQLKKSIAKYARLHAIVRVLDRGGEPRAPMTDMHGNVTTPSDVRHMLSALENNALALGEEIDQVERLLEGGMPERSEGAMPARHRQTALRPGSIPKRYVRLHELELQHSMPFRKATILERHGPFSYALSQFDGVPTPHQFMLYIVRDDKNGIVSLKLSTLDVHLFQPLEKGRPMGGFGSLHEPLIKIGVPFWYQPSANLYTMRDQTYWADIASMVDRERRPELPAEAVSSQRSSLLHLLFGTCFEDIKMYVPNVREVQRVNGFVSRYWYSLLFRTHPSLFYMSFNESVWRLPEPLKCMGSARQSTGNNIYRTAQYVFEHTDAAEFELVMRSGRIREEVRQLTSSVH